MIYTPVHDPKYDLIGKRADEIYLRYYKKLFNTLEINTFEHLQAKHPEIREINSILQGAFIIKMQNYKTWLKYKMLGHKPIIGIFSGFAYLLNWIKYSKSPPYYDIFIIWSKQ